MKSLTIRLFVLGALLTFLIGAVAVVHGDTVERSRHKETIPSFCDSSSDQGSSTSCKQESEVTNYACENDGKEGSVSCSLGNSCTENNQPGTICNCEIWCIDKKEGIDL